MVVFTWKGAVVTARKAADGWQGAPPDCPLDSFPDETAAAARLGGEVRSDEKPEPTPAPEKE